MVSGIRVGTESFFRVDIEGHGVVVDIQEECGWSGTHRFYTIANLSKDYSPWHPAVEMDYELGTCVVRCSDDYTVEPW